MNDLIIIGGGPAGIAAGVYAARKRLKSVLLTDAIGGQSIDSVGIENWIGTPKVSGIDLAKMFERHLSTVKEGMVDLRVGERVEKLGRVDEHFTVTTNSGTYAARTIFIASGAGRRKLEVPGAQEFENKGVVYCASCDGPLFAGQDVAVIGGGNAGFETALQLLAYCKSVTLLHRHKEFKADPVSIEKALAHSNMRTVANAEPTAVKGEQFVTGLTYRDKDTGEEGGLAVTGVFVEAGVIPNTSFAEGFLALDPVKRIVADPKNQRTSVEGVWAAGDCTDELYHQNNIAAGDGVKALEDIYLWLKKH